MNGMLNIEREIFIAASPETVFRFFVEPAFMARWFGQQHILDPRPGGIFASRSPPAILLAESTRKSHRIAASRSLGDGRAGMICRPAAHWSRLNSSPKTAAPCSDFDTAASRQWRRHRSRQRSMGRDGRATWGDSKKQCAIPASHERRKL